MVVPASTPEGFTAAALKTLLDHSKPTELKLYGTWFCPFVQRSWIAVEESGLPYTFMDTGSPYNTENKKKIYLLNPAGKIPILDDKDMIITESLDICVYLAEKFSSPAHRLYPTDGTKKLLVAKYANFVGDVLHPTFHLYLTLPLGTPEFEAKRQEVLGCWRELLLAANNDGPYFLGEEFSLVDVILGPVLSRMWLWEELKGFRMTDLDDVDIKNGEKEKEWFSMRLAKWRQALEERQSIKSTLSERQRYRPIYEYFAAGGQ